MPLVTQLPGPACTSVLSLHDQPLLPISHSVCSYTASVISKRAESSHLLCNRHSWHMEDHVAVLRRLRWGQVPYANLRYRNGPHDRLRRALAASVKAVGTFHALSTVQCALVPLQDTACAGMRCMPTDACIASNGSRKSPEGFFSGNSLLQK